MTELPRRREKHIHQECWHIYYGDVKVGTIEQRAGVPVDVDQWGWQCGFYPGVEPAEHLSGTAPTFEQARADFEEAWRLFSAKRTPEDYAAYRKNRDFHAWKYAMWVAHCMLPTQVENGISRCFCGAEVTNKTIDDHMAVAHAGPVEDA